MKDHHLRLIYYFLRKRLRLEDAQDLAQEAFLVLWTKRERSEPPHIKFLFGIARKLYFAYLKSRSITDVDLDDLSRQLDPADRAECAEESIPGETPIPGGVSADKILQSAGLSQKQRKVLHLIYVEGLSLQEAGEKLGIAKGSVQLHARRAVAELHRIWYSLHPEKNK